MTADTLPKADGKGAAKTTAPAAKTTAARKPPTKGKPAGRRRTPLTEPLAGLLSSAGLLLYASDRTRADGEVILAGAPRLAEALSEVAVEQAAAGKPQLYDTLKGITTASMWSNVVVAALAIVVPILANHGVIPPTLAGAVTAAAGATGDGATLDADMLAALDEARRMAEAANVTDGGAEAGAQLRAVPDAKAAP